jgi:class 3 adenylate cyclase
MAVLFLDICGFSKMNSFSAAEQERVLQVSNLFIAEMLTVLKTRAGHFEKNTGDGLMGYFEGALVAIGNPANSACKAMSLIPGGGIVLGDKAQKLLPEDLRGRTMRLGQIAGYVYEKTSEIYCGWELTYRVAQPSSTASDVVRRVLGGQ